ncbi:shikimate dehydrogenase [Microvirga pudoricolor]|uniref:shikimate dehydrogenase n=1 Tax=Microvirga pudoricolor TaxID=2778729 RepID=UPI0019529D85|nr:shikimate dehydrogenase [Microvirga pudoricolor]MBM6593913.1 shikimate dehydrogenase [Microvirga pudoricolor]
MAKAFVIGQPIQHSRSPLIHGHWLRKHGLDGSYEGIEVAPQDLARFLKSFAANGYAGGNVTIPHKEAAFAVVDRRTSRAERLRAVNTVWVEDGVLWGDNTDVEGFMANLDQSLGEGWDAVEGGALVIGGGGAARGVVAGLQERGIRPIRVANRTAAKAADLVRDLDPTGQDLEAVAWEDLNEAARQAGLIVNTTSLGMAGQPPLDIALTDAKPGAIVADIVYVPLKTPLLATAEARGLRIVDGLGMLLHQAVPGFRRWFGVEPRVTPELRALIVADLERPK